MTSWAILTKNQVTDFRRKIPDIEAVPHRTYYLGSPEFRENYEELTLAANRYVRKVFQQFYPKDAPIVVFEPWHTSYLMTMASPIEEWQYDVIGGRADSVYFLTESCKQGSFYDYDTSSITFFGGDLLKTATFTGSPILRYLINQDGKKLLKASQVPHLARHKHLFL